MKRASLRGCGLAGLLVGFALVAAGCGGGARAASGAGAGGAPASAAAAASVPAAAVVQANGGGDFCALIAKADNNQSVAGTSVASIQAKIATARAEEQQALDIAPQDIKADVTLLFAASNAVYDALVNVNYDYSKLKATDMAPLEAADVVAAEKRLKTYTTTVCKIS
jgi:hypothetical protein